MNVSVVNGLTEHKTPELLLGDVLKLEQLELDPKPPINTFKVKEPDFTVEQSGPSHEFKQPEAKGAFLTQFPSSLLKLKKTLFFSCNAAE